MYDKIKLAETLKTFRIDHNLTQDKFGALVGIKKSAVSKWESGENQPTIENLWKLADHFGVTVDALIGRE